MHEINQEGINTALAALDLARQAQATDARDKIYGILATPCVKSLTNISLYFRIELPETYIKFTRETSSNDDHGLDILRLNHSPA